MLDQVRACIAEHAMLPMGARVLVALSGGADSVALLRALCALGYQVRALHVNHLLRAQQAMRDERFCRALCAQLAIPLEVERCDIAALARARGLGIEETAREVRYEVLERAARGDKIATAHTADDLLETMLFHLVRGSGPRGLAGIPPVRGSVVRPLIAVERVTVERYLHELGQSFVTDSTNFSGENMRSRLRLTVIPALKQINPAAAHAAVRLSALLRQDEQYLSEETGALLAQAQEREDVWWIAPLQSASPALRTRALYQMACRAGVSRKALGFSHLCALERLLYADCPSAQYSLPNGVVARRVYERLCFAPPPVAVSAEIVPLPIPYAGEIFGGSVSLTLTIDKKSGSVHNLDNTFCVDCGTIDSITLCARTRRTGDHIRLHPNGGSKTLKKLMIERHIPQAIRDRLVVLADVHGIIAVEGLGCDCTRTQDIKQPLRIKIERNGKYGI